jgi:hypothetical protein
MQLINEALSPPARISGARRWLGALGRATLLSSLFAVGSASAAAAPSGEVLLQAPPLLRRATVEIDGQPAGPLPPTQTLQLPPGPHKLTLLQGRWRLSADVEVRAGQRALLRWPRPGAGVVSYPPTVALLVEPADAPIDLRQAAIDSLHRAHFSVLGEFGVPAESMRSFGCAESLACLEELAQTHSLRNVLSVQTHLTPQGYAIDVRLFDSETGDLAARRSELCPSPLCVLARAKLWVGALVNETLLLAAKRQTGLLEISSQPLGAEVLVDGRRLGVTPYRRAASVGEHEVVVHKTGYLDYQNTVDVGPGRGSALDAVLKLDTPPPPPPPPPPPVPTGRNLSRRR